MILSSRPDRSSFTVVPEYSISRWEMTGSVFMQCSSATIAIKSTILILALPGGLEYFPGKDEGNRDESVEDPDFPGM